MDTKRKRLYPAVNPIPILFLDHATALGGAERSLLFLLKHLDRTRVQPHLACPEGALAQHARALGVPVHVMLLPRLRRSPRSPLDLITHAGALARLARDVGTRALYGNTVRASFYAALAAHMSRRPFIWHMRDFWLSESRPRYLWPDHLGKSLLCRAATRVVANSQATARHLPCPDRVTVIYNGIEVEHYDPTMDGTTFRRQYDIPPEAPLVGTVGRLRPWKGQDRFLRIFARVLEAVPDAWAVVVGGSVFGVEDGYEERVHHLAHELGIGKRVVFTGHLEDVRPALAAMDVFVHPGDPEPFGLVVVEAMAMAKLVVAFAHGALPEIVVDGETGLLVPPGAEEALARSVADLLSDRIRALRLGRAGRARVEKHFAASRTAREVMSLLQHIE